MDIGREGEDRPPEERLRRRAPFPPLPPGLAAPFRQFFASAAVPCPYLPGRSERKLIVELGGRDAAGFYDELSRAGFRRSHRFAYRPACPACAACVPVRIAVERFADTRSLRRVRNANRDLSGRLLAARATAEQYLLFSAYQRARHRDSEMALMSYADYRGMVEDTPVKSEIAEFRDPAGTLLAAALIDRLDDGVSAVYSFYDPSAAKRGLGTWSILWLVEECRRAQKPYVYLGYWIGDSPKMAYKARFTALERLLPGGWAEFNASGRHPRESGGPGARAPMHAAAFPLAGE